MNYWLVKFAPFRCSWEDILRNGKFEIYSVRSAQARNNLRKMKLNDKVLFYHSQQENQVMGEMKVIAEAYQDFTTDDTRWLSVTFEPVATLPRPVSLKQIKSHPELINIGLIKQPRLAVMQLHGKEYETIIKLSEKI